MNNPDRPGVGRQREKAGLSRAALGQNSTDWWQDEMGVGGVVASYLLWVGWDGEIPTRLWTCGPGAGGGMGICP